jgi:sulfate permease, SulP family
MNASSSGQNNPPPPAASSGWRHSLPAYHWLAAYRLAWLRADLAAGLTLAAYAIPVSLAYSSLAGLPPQTGIYCYLLGGIGYALFGTSRHLAVGPTSAISLLLGVTLARLAGGDPGQIAAMASMATLLVALVFVGAWVLRLSVIVNFFSDSLLTGFKAGAALVIASTQVAKLIGVHGGGDNFFARIGLAILQVGHVNLLVLTIGLGTVGLLLLGEKYLPGRPSALAVVIVSLGVMAGLSGHNVPVAGHLQGGLPQLPWQHLRLPDWSFLEWRELTRLAFACFLLSYIESISAARAFALKHQDELDARQELLALGQANLLSALGQGFPVAGGLSQTAVNEKAGARTPMSLVVASVALGFCLLFLTSFFRNLPEAVLAAIVLVSVKGLIDVREMRHLWRASRFDFYAALAAFVGVLFLGILDGVIVATIASLLMLLGRTANPHVAFLGRIPGTVRFSDRARHPDNEMLPGILAFRVESSLFYFNVEHVHRTVVTELNQSPETFKRVICDLSTSPIIDIAGARMMIRLHEELEAKGIFFTVAEAHGEARDMLRAEGFEEKVGHISRKESLDAAIARLRQPGAIPEPTTNEQINTG